MADVRVYLPYHVTGLWVAATVLGGAVTVERDGYRMTLRLPEHPSSFQRRTRSPGPLGEASRVMYQDPSTPPYDWVSVSVVEVECDVHVPDVADERQLLGDGLDDKEMLAALQHAIDPTRDLSRDFVHELLEWARSYGQHWLGLSSDAIQAAGPASVQGAETGEWIRTQPTWKGSAMGLRDTDAIDDDQFAAIVQGLEAGREPALPERLLAEAKHLAWVGLGVTPRVPS